MKSKFETVCELFHTDVALTLENNNLLEGVDIKEPFYAEVWHRAGRWVCTARYMKNDKMFEHVVEFSDETVDACFDKMK